MLNYYCFHPVWNFFHFHHVLFTFKYQKNTVFISFFRLKFFLDLSRLFLNIIFLARFLDMIIQNLLHWFLIYDYYLLILVSYEKLQSRNYRRGRGGTAPGHTRLLGTKLPVKGEETFLAINTTKQYRIIRQ